MNELLNSIHITPLWYLIPSLLMFCAGVYGFLTRKNLIAMLISIELMLNAVDINFVVFNRYFFPPGSLSKGARSCRSHPKQDP